MRRLYQAGFFLILIIGAYFRFSYLNWGSPYFFHPDEDNITSSILQMSFKQLNPHFFAYGGFPIYFTFLLSSLVSFGKNSFPSIAYTLRFISSTLSFLLLPSIFYIGKKMYGRSVGLIATLLATVSIGFIQFAHFGTFEMWLTFFTLWLFYFSYRFWEKHTVSFLAAVSLIGGILMSIKVSSIFFLPIPLGIILSHKNTLKKKILYSLFYIFFVTLFYLITNPYLLFDTTSFLSSLTYESSVAVGSLPVFYTQSFLHTIPIIFQLQHVLPFLMNPIVFIVSLCCFGYVLLFIVKRRENRYVFLILFFLISFLSQATLFVKWTRYIVPTLPFLYFFTAVVLAKIKTSLQICITASLFLISFVLAVAFINMAYVTDSRIRGASFVSKYATGETVIMEPYDIGAIVFNPSFPQAKIVDLYNLEQDQTIQSQLTTLLASGKFFISPSQRLLHSRLANPNDFPKGYTLYSKLLNGALGFHVFYQTPCDIWCTIIYAGNPIQGSVEETATVFDHPFVTIFKKT